MQLEKNTDDQWKEIDNWKEWCDGQIYIHTGTSSVQGDDT